MTEYENEYERQTAERRRIEEIERIQKIREGKQALLDWQKVLVEQTSGEDRVQDDLERHHKEQQLEIIHEILPLYTQLDLSLPDRSE